MAWLWKADQLLNHPPALVSPTKSWNIGPEAIGGKDAVAAITVAANKATKPGFAGATLGFGVALAVAGAAETSCLKGHWSR